MERLEAYDWPGNVRELENTMERAVALETGKRISLEGLPERILMYYQNNFAKQQEQENSSRLIPDGGIDLEKHIAELERAFLLGALECSGGVRTKAAELLRMTYRSFRHYAKKYQV